jgi:hypothetical protein
MFQVDFLDARDTSLECVGFLLGLHGSMGLLKLLQSPDMLEEQVNRIQQMWIKGSDDPSR